MSLPSGGGLDTQGAVEGGVGDYNNNMHKIKDKRTLLGRVHKAENVRGFGFPKDKKGESQIYRVFINRKTRPKFPKSFPSENVGDASLCCGSLLSCWGKDCGTSTNLYRQSAQSSPQPPEKGGAHRRRRAPGALAAGVPVTPAVSRNSSNKNPINVITH